MSTADEPTDESLQHRTALLTWQTAVIAAIAAVITFVSTVIGLGGVGGLVGIFVSPVGSITSPTGPSVSKTFRLAGTQENIGKNNVIWGASRRYDDGKFYPMEKPCASFNDNQFDCGAFYLGNQEGADVGADFDLIIVEADVQAVGVFLRAQVEKTPLPQLPPGAIILDRLQVTRT